MGAYEIYSTSPFFNCLSEEKILTVLYELELVHISTNTLVINWLSFLGVFQYPVKIKLEPMMQSHIFALKTEFVILRWM